MKQTYFRSVLTMAGSALAVALSGCATKPAPVAESWIEPRPLGKELSTYRPPREATNVPALPPPIEEPTGELALRQALALALARNPALAAFSWDVRIGEARILQAGLRPNPNVLLDVQDFGGSGNYQGLSGSETTLTLSQLIELGGKRTARLREARLSRELAGWDYETARLDVFTQTVQAFVEVLSLQQRLALTEETVRLAEEVVAAVKKRVEAARTFAVEGTKAEVALASAQIERDQTQRALNAARQRLSANWGNTQPRFERVAGNLESIASVPPADQLIQRVQQNPELARWATEISQREATLKREKSKAIPDITLGAGYRRKEESGDNVAVLAVSIPLPLFNRNQGNIKEAEYRLARVQEEQRAAELRVKTALGQTWQRLAAAHAELTALKEKVLPGAQTAFETVSRYYGEGRLSYLEVLDAQRTFFTARAQYLRALSDYHQAEQASERLIGAPLTSTTNQP